MNKDSKESFITSKKFMIVLTFLGLYLLSSGTSWALFSYLKSDPSGVDYSGGAIADTRSKIDNLPKTEECPINGMMYTEPERAIWEERRPITAIVENHHESRPLEGLHKADVVYEAVAEGGITRHLGVFYCGVSAEDVRVAPIRSARVYFVSWAAEYGDNPLFTHVGGANNICGNCPGGVKPRGQVAPEVRAIELLVDLGWRVPQGNDFDTTYDTGFPVLFRDAERLGRQIASEHTMVGTTDALFEQGAERGFAFEDESGNEWSENYRAWTFKDDDPKNADAKKISFEFWSNWPEYDVVWNYDSGTNLYTRSVGGEVAKDNKSGSPFVAKNVVIQFVEETGPVDTEKHMFYKTVGAGDALIFQNGTVIEGTWEKDSITDRTLFYDESGKEISFVRGQIWIEGVPEGNDINY